MKQKYYFTSSFVNYDGISTRLKSSKGFISFHDCNEKYIPFRFSVGDRLKRLCLVTLFLIHFIGGFSLVSQFTFTSVAGTYNQLTTQGTVAASGSWNDTVVSLPPGTIPFNYRINDTNFTDLHINPNGYITLGNTGNLGTTMPIASATSGPIVIAGFALDLSGGYDSEIRYAVVGNSPNRDFVIQWSNAYCMSSPQISVSFQIRLQETTNNAIVSYGGANANLFSSAYPQVGLRGFTNGDFNDLVGANWSNPSAGGTNAATMSLVAGAQPFTGLTYTWVNPTPSIPPNPAINPTPVNGNIIAAILPVLQWASGGGEPAGYKLYFGTSPTPPLLQDVGSATSYTFPTNLSPETVYYWKVVPYNFAGDALNCPVWSFRTLAYISRVIGTETNSILYPVVPYTNYTYSQSIYLQTDINLANTMVKQISYYWNGPAAGTNSGNWTVYMGHTGQSYFSNQIFSGVDWVPYSQLTQVFSGTVALPATPGWVTIVLQTPFTYTNASNLVIAVDENNPGLDSGSGSFMGTYSPWNRSVRASGSENINPGLPPVFSAEVASAFPNIILEFQEIPPILTATPVSWDYGRLLLNAFSDKQFSITNTGGSILSLQNIAVSGAYYALTQPLVFPINLSAGQSMSFTVRYQPTAVGIHPGAVTITDSRTQTVLPLTGEGYEVTVQVPPDYILNFDEWPPFLWTPAGGTFTWVQHTDTSGNNWGLARNFNKWSGEYAILTSRPIHISTASQLRFLWSHYYNPVFSPNESILISLSQDGTNWTDVFNLAGPAFNSNDGATNITSGSGVVQTVNIPSAFINTTLQIRIISYADLGANLFIDDLIVREVPTGPPGHVQLTLPLNNASNLNPTNTVLKWNPGTGGAPTSYRVYLSPNITEILTHYFYDTGATPCELKLPRAGLSLGYSTTWYWAVIPSNGAGSPGTGFEIRSFTTMPCNVIQTFPWTEDFESCTDMNSFPPPGWQNIGMDGSNTNWWLTSENHTTGGNKSIYHSYSESNEDDWMVSIPVAIPAQGSYALSFWRRHYYNACYYRESVLFSTGSSDPAMGAFTEIHVVPSASYDWVQTIIPLGQFAGQTGVFAFRYQGTNADGWHIDDVKVMGGSADYEPPSITYNPTLNTLRTDISYSISATIADDLIWNSGIASAILSYSVNGGQSFDLSMTPTQNTYTVQIPAQSLNSTVQYRITATDNSAQHNFSQTELYELRVEDPVWLRYDDGTPTTGLGLGNGSWGFGVLYQNPLFGTGETLQVNAVLGSLISSGSGDLIIYASDGVNLTPVMTPVHVVFQENTPNVTQVEVSINTAYFMVTFQNLDATCFAPVDISRKYPGTQFLIVNGSYNSFDQLGVNGVWSMATQVQTMPDFNLDAPVVFAMEAWGDICLTWQPVQNAVSYRVESSPDPFASDWQFVAVVTNPVYIWSGTDSKLYFRVIASTYIPGGRTSEQTIPPGNTNAMRKSELIPGLRFKELLSE